MSQHPGAQRPGPAPHPLMAQAVTRATAPMAASATDLTKVYGQGETRVTALDAVSVEFDRGRFTLDSQSGAEVLGFLRSSVLELGQTVVMVTHDPVAASYADRVVFLADGRIVDFLCQPTADTVLDRMLRLSSTASRHSG